MPADAPDACEPPTGGRRALDHDERLRVPVLWWALAAGFVFSVWVAYDVAAGPLLAGLVGAALALAAAALLVGYGRVRVSAGDDGLSAGRARLPLDAMGGVRALSAEQTRLLRGRDVDVSAYLVLRGYLPRAVQVVVDDPDDPTPYWLVSTRSPDRLVAGLIAARERCGRG